MAVAGRTATTVDRPRSRRRSGGQQRRHEWQRQWNRNRWQWKWWRRVFVREDRTATSAEPAPDPEPEPDPDPKFDGPDDLAPNPGPEPTPPDDLAPNPDPDPDPVDADDIAAAPEPGTLKVHPNFAEVTLHGKGYENAEYVCFGNPGDLSVHWIVNDGVVIKSNPLNGDLEAGAVTCPLVWTDYWELEPGTPTR